MTPTAKARTRGIRRRWRVGFCQHALELYSMWGVVVRLDPR